MSSSSASLVFNVSNPVFFLLLYLSFYADHRAIRVALDLGLHMQFSNEQASALGLDETQTDLRRRVFWNVVCLDRIISCGTGRVCTIIRNQIEVDVPPSDMKIRTNDGLQRSLVDPYPYFCRLMLLLGSVSDELNSHLRARQTKTAAATTPTAMGDGGGPFENVLSPGGSESIELSLRPFQQQVTDFYASLPPDLHFNVVRIICFHRERLKLIRAFGQSTISKRT